jgi:hypothetical protein
MKNQSLFKQPYKFAAIGGAFWGLALFFGTLLAAATGYGRPFFELVGGLYPNYKISFSGSLFGLLFGFIDGFIICYLIAYFAGGGRKQRREKK